MFTLTNLVIFAVGGVFLAVWLLLYVKGMKHAALFEALEEKEYPLKGSGKKLRKKNCGT